VILFSPRKKTQQIHQELLNRGFADRPEIRTIYTNEKSSAFIVPSHSHFCLNKMATHSNNHVWFYVDVRGIRQKCHSKNPIVYGGGCCCSHYTSEIIPLSKEEKHTLFPGKQQRPRKRRKQTQSSKPMFNLRSSMENDEIQKAIMFLSTT
jgi:hypothetical protein